MCPPGRVTHPGRRALWLSGGTRGGGQGQWAKSKERAFANTLCPRLRLRLLTRSHSVSGVFEVVGASRGASSTKVRYIV